MHACWAYAIPMAYCIASYSKGAQGKSSDQGYCILLICACMSMAELAIMWNLLSEVNKINCVYTKQVFKNTLRNKSYICMVIKRN